MATLNILPAEKCRWDGVALGEVMLRFDPIDVPFERARTCRIWHGGGEVNVAEGMAYCFGLRTTVLTALVDDGFGRNIECQFRETGVDTSHILWFKPGGKGGKYVTDKKGTLMNGVNATFRGKGVVPSKTEYYRAHTPVREVGAEDYDFDALFRQGVRWAHTGGIYSLLSPRTAETAVEYLKTAGQYGAVRSTDLNYRANVEPNKDRARETHGRRRFLRLGRHLGPAEGQGAGRGGGVGRRPRHPGAGDARRHHHGHAGDGRGRGEARQEGRRRDGHAVRTHKARTAKTPRSPRRTPGRFRQERVRRTV